MYKQKFISNNDTLFYTHQDSSDWLHRSHIMQYRCGYCNLEYLWGYAAATPNRTLQLLQLAVATSVTALYETGLVAGRWNVNVFKCTPIHGTAFSFRSLRVIVTKLSVFKLQLTVLFIKREIGYIYFVVTYLFQKVPFHCHYTAKVQTSIYNTVRQKGNW